MSAGVGTLDRLGAVWAGHAFDPRALDDFCRATVAGFVGPVAVEQFHGGASNPTFLVTDTATAARFVLRKQPPGRLLARAHAIDREYRVMAALAATAVPVPEMVAWCDDAAVIGTPFYLMRFVDGRIYKDNRLADMTPADRRAAYRDVARVLATLHRVDPAAVGLADFGRASGFYPRQLARFTRQYHDAGGGIAALDRLIGRLPARLPRVDEAKLIHGDCRQENLLFAPDAPRVAALLDWELSTTGHPLSDVAFFCLFYHADFTSWGSAATIDFAASGIPTEAAFVADYAQAAGRETIDDWSFHLAFAAFRLAVIAHGVQRRIAAGDARPREGADSAGDWAALAERLLG